MLKTVVERFRSFTRKVMFFIESLIFHVSTIISGDNCQFKKLNSCWISVFEFITFSRNQGVIQSKMDVSIPILTKLVNKCGKEYLCLVIVQIIKEKLHSCKMVFHTDQTLCRLWRCYLTHKVTAQFKIIRKRDAK